MKKDNIVLLLSLLCFCALNYLMLFHVDSGIQTNEPEPTITESTVPEEEKIAVPDPEYFFGVDELVFEKLPEEAILAYYNLLTEKCGFVAASSNVYDVVDRFDHSESEKYWVSFSSIRQKDGLIYSLVQFSEYCRKEKLETWNGDISKYLYNPNHWQDCAACEGTGRCPYCILGGMSIFVSTDDCKECEKGDCAKCFEGKIYVIPWEEMTVEEKLESDWKRYSREFIRTD